MEGRELKLLLLEQDSNLAESIVKGFEKQGFEIEVVTNSDEAAEKISSNEFIAFISELTFDGKFKDLSELLEHIDKDKNNLCSIIAIGDNRNYPIAKAFSKGVDAVFWKPFQQVTLEELVKVTVIPHILDRKQRRFSRMDMLENTTVEIKDSAQTIITQCENISQGGMLVSHKNKSGLTLGSEIDFKLTEQREKELIEISGKATVAWVKSEETRLCTIESIGLTFTLTDNNRENIFKFVNFHKTERFIGD